MTPSSTGVEFAKTVDGVLEPKIVRPESGAAFVKLNVAGVVTPGADAVTVKLPVTLFAVGTGDTAMPEAFVFTVITFAPLNEALGPLDGSVNVTGIPAAGFDKASVTLA